MALRETVAKGLGHPVGVHTAAHQTSDALVLLVHQILVLQVALCRVNAGQTLVFQLLGRVEQMVVAQIGHAQAVGAAIVEAQPTALHGFGRDHHHTRRSLRTVEGRSRGVFEHRHRLDVVHVHVVDVVGAHF